MQPMQRGNRDLRRGDQGLPQRDRDRQLVPVRRRARSSPGAATSTSRSPATPSASRCVWRSRSTSPDSSRPALGRRSDPGAPPRRRDGVTGRGLRRALLAGGLASALVVQWMVGHRVGRGRGTPTPDALGRHRRRGAGRDECTRGDRGGPAGTARAGDRGARHPRPPGRRCRSSRTIPFVIMSVSKAFTAAVVLALVERGDLDLDDRVARYVPGWDRRITVRHLLNHRSGLPSWGNKDDPPDSPRDDLENADFSRRFTMDGEPRAGARDAVAGPSRDEDRTTRTPTRCSLGLVIESVTGGSVADAYHRYVLDPLELSSTGYLPQETPPRPPIPGVLFIARHRHRDRHLAVRAGLVPDARRPGRRDGLRRARPAPVRDRLPARQLPDPRPWPGRRVGSTAAAPGSASSASAGAGTASSTAATGHDVPAHRLRGQRPGRRGPRGPRPEARRDRLVFANSSQRGKLDPFVKRVFDQVG